MEGGVRNGDAHSSRRQVLNVQCRSNFTGRVACLIGKRRASIGVPQALRVSREHDQANLCKKGVSVGRRTIRLARPAFRTKQECDGVFGRSQGIHRAGADTTTYVHFSQIANIKSALKRSAFSSNLSSNARASTSRGPQPSSFTPCCRKQESTGVGNPSLPCLAAQH